MLGCRWFRCLGVLSVTAIVAGVACQSHASVDDEPYLFRLFFALDRASNFSTTAGRQASAAYTGASSVNPASDDWTPNRETNVEIVYTQIFAIAESDAWLTTEAVTVNIGTADSGSFTVAYARTDVPKGDTNAGLENDVRSNEFFLGYSKRVSDFVAVGVQGRLTDAYIGDAFFSSLVPGVPLRSDIDLLSLDLSFGLLWQIDSTWHVGASGMVGWMDIDSVTRNTAGPPGLFMLSVDDDVRTNAARIGFAYTPNRDFGLYIDAHYMHVESNMLGNGDTARLIVGVEHRINDAWAMRGGASVDIEADWTLSAGFSYTGFKALQLHAGYQYNATPEIDPEFGALHAISLSATILF